jgi:hypothetical protein
MNINNVSYKWVCSLLFQCVMSVLYWCMRSVAVFVMEHVLVFKDLECFFTPFLKHDVDDVCTDQFCNIALRALIWNQLHLVCLCVLWAQYSNTDVWIHIFMKSVSHIWVYFVHVCSLLISHMFNNKNNKSVCSVYACYHHSPITGV